MGVLLDAPAFTVAILTQTKLQPAEVLFLLVVDSRTVQILQFRLDFVLHLMTEVFDGLHVDLRLQFLVLFLFSLFAKTFFANTERDEDKHDRANDRNADHRPFGQSGAGLDRFVLVYHFTPNVLDRALTDAFGIVRFTKSVHPLLCSCSKSAPVRTPVLTLLANSEAVFFSMSCIWSTLASSLLYLMS